MAGVHITKLSTIKHKWAQRWNEIHKGRYQGLAKACYRTENSQALPTQRMVMTKQSGLLLNLQNNLK